MAGSLFPCGRCTAPNGGETYYERQMVCEPCYVEDAVVEHRVHLLRVGDHYSLIYNMNAFLSSNGERMAGSRSRSHASVHICPTWRCGFKNKANLQNHLELARVNPCSYDAGKRTALLKFPEKEKLQHLVKFEAGSPAELAPPSDAVAERVHRVQRRAASAAFRVVTHNVFMVPESEKVFLTRTENHDHEHAAIERFLRACLRQAQRCKFWRQSTNVAPQLSAEERDRHQNATRCEPCLATFIPGHPWKMKVLHHRHGTGLLLVQP